MCLRLWFDAGRPPDSPSTLRRQSRNSDPDTQPRRSPQPPRSPRSPRARRSPQPPRARSPRPVNLKNLHHAPFFQNGAKSGFEMCFGPSTLGTGAKTRLESRIKEFTPHCVCSPHAHAQSRSQSHITYHKKYISNPYVGYITITHMYITMRCSQHLDSREYFLQFFFCYFCYFFAIGSQHQ